MSSDPGTSDVVRRTWDDETYSRRAAQRLAVGEEEGSRRRKVPFVPAEHRVALVAPRAGERLDTEAIAGSSIVVADGASKCESGAFYCKHCDVLSHDSSAYLNHMNSRAHQAVMGVAMRVKRSTAEEVRSAFEVALEKRESRNAAMNRGFMTLDQLLKLREEKTAAEKQAKRAAKGSRANERLRNAEGVASEKVEINLADAVTVNPKVIDSDDEEVKLVERQMQEAGLPTSFG